MNKTMNKTLCENEQGSLVAALVIVVVALLLAFTLVSQIATVENTTVYSSNISSAVSEANAAVNDALYQLDQYDPTNTSGPPIPTSFCGSDATPVPPGCTAIPFHAPGTWTYQATQVPGPTSDVVSYKITATATVNGVSRTVNVYAQRFEAHEGLIATDGFTGNGNFSMYPTNSTGQLLNDTDNDASSLTSSVGDPDNDGDLDEVGSAAVNQNAINCSGLLNGIINIYGRSKALTSNCNGTATGTPPLDPGLPQYGNCPAPYTIPKTPCLPVGSYNACPASGVFGGSTNASIPAGIYVCYQPISINADLTTQGPVQIWDFIPSGFSGSVLNFSGTKSGNNQINYNNGTIEPSTNLEIFISDPTPCQFNNGSPISNSITFNSHGSNVPAISAELYAPNDSLYMNGAPFSTWTGNILACYWNSNGGGNGKSTLNDNVNYSQYYGNWYTTGYQD